MRSATPLPCATSPLSTVENHPAIWALHQAFEQRRRAFLGLLLALLGSGVPGCVVETAHAEEHTHRCESIGPPSIGDCCRLREHGRCTLTGKAQCTPQGCSCGHTCAPSCGGCL